MRITLYTLEAYHKRNNKSSIPVAVEPLKNVSVENICEAHQHDYFQVILACEGSVNHVIEDNSYVIKKDSVSVVFPHQIHKAVFDPYIKGWVLMFDEVMFCSDLLKKELRSYSVDLHRKLNHIELSTEKYEEIRHIVEKIHTLYKEINPIRQEQIRFYIKILLLQLIEHTHEKTQLRKNIRQVDIYSGFKVLIEDNYKEIKTVSEYSSMMGISAKKLNEVCKKESGMTALAVIHERIMVEVRRMFLYCDSLNKEIAYQLGFTSPSALNKFIFSQTGKTPTELRHSLAEKDKK